MPESFQKAYFPVPTTTLHICLNKKNCLIKQFVSCTITYLCTRSMYTLYLILFRKIYKLVLLDMCSSIVHIFFSFRSKRSIKALPILVKNKTIGAMPSNNASIIYFNSDSNVPTYELYICTQNSNTKICSTLNKMCFQKFSCR